MHRVTKFFTIQHLDFISVDHRIESPLHPTAGNLQPPDARCFSSLALLLPVDRDGENISMTIKRFESRFVYDERLSTPFESISLKTQLRCFFPIFQFKSTHNLSLPFTALVVKEIHSHGNKKSSKSR